MKKKSILLSILAFSVFVSLFIFPTAAETKYESESNNTYETADVTGNDNNNYGSLSSTTDRDWWKITFNQDGLVNFWLGQVPSSYNYKMDLYYYATSTIINMATTTTQAPGNPGLIRARVHTGVTYYICISSTSGVSGSNYLFRAKVYNLNRAGLFDFDYQFPDIYINTTGIRSTLMSSIWSMGFSADTYDNNTATSFSNFLPGSDMVILNGHGTHGCICFTNNTNFYGKEVDPNMPAFVNFGTEGLSQVDLLVLSSCFSGSDAWSSSYGNLVTEAKNAGVMCVIGWNPKTSIGAANIWLSRFLSGMEDEMSVAAAISMTNYYCTNNSTIPVDQIPAITNIVTGTSPTEALVLG